MICATLKVTAIEYFERTGSYIYTGSYIKQLLHISWDVKLIVTVTQTRNARPVVARPGSRDATPDAAPGRYAFKYAGRLCGDIKIGASRDHLQWSAVSARSNTSGVSR